MRRPGRTYRIYDWGPVTLALDPESRGGVYSPRISLTYRWRRRRRDMTRWGPGCEYVVTYPSIRVSLPVIGWRRAWKLRRLGARRLYMFESRLVYRWFSAPHDPEVGTR